MGAWVLSESDKLDPTNRNKFLQFFEEDLFQARAYYRNLEKWRKMGLKIPAKFWTQAKADIEDSKRNLALAKSKLKK